MPVPAFSPSKGRRGHASQQGAQAYCRSNTDRPLLLVVLRATGFPCCFLAFAASQLHSLLSACVPWFPLCFDYLFLRLPSPLSQGGLLPMLPSLCRSAPWSRSPLGGVRTQHCWDMQGSALRGRDGNLPEVISPKPPSEPAYLQAPLQRCTQWR